MKTFSEITNIIKNSHKKGFEEGMITRGFVSGERAKFIRCLIAESYPLNSVNIRNFRDFTVLEHSFTSTSEYNLIKSDCMSATVSVMDSILYELGEEI